jgi:hypothetical protein
MRHWSVALPPLPTSGDAGPVYPQEVNQSMNNTIGAAWLCALAMCQSALAARPFETDDAGTVAPGTFESEFGSESWKDDAAFGIGLKHGLTERMDLGVSMGYAA